MGGGGRRECVLPNAFVKVGHETPFLQRSFIESPHLRQTGWFNLWSRREAGGGWQGAHLVVDDEGGEEKRKNKEVGAAAFLPPNAAQKCSAVVHGWCA